MVPDSRHAHKECGGVKHVCECSTPPPPFSTWDRGYEYNIRITIKIS